MNATARRPDRQDEVMDAVHAACARIAPTWPLDRYIAVNPWLGYAERPIAAAGVELAQLCGSRMLMPRAWFRAQWQAGRVQARHLEQAAARAGSTLTPEALVAALETPQPVPALFPLVTARLDAEADEPAHVPTWEDFVVQDASSACAAYFTQDVLPGTLYADWRAAAIADPAARIVMGLRGSRAFFRALPAEPQALIAAAHAALGYPANAWESACGALLRSVNGWAAWCAYLRWQARLAGREDDHLVQLLAVRLAWEWALHALACDDAARQAWRVCVARHQPAAPVAEDWIWLDALELAWREPLIAGLATAGPAARVTPAVQAVFCIDVRSEPMRRALEAAEPGVATHGFAGFFGLPVAYQPLGTAAAQARLPGLLSPALHVADTTGDAAADTALAQTRQGRLGLANAWRAFRTAAPSAFGFVETVGPFYAAKLLAAALGADSASRPEQAGLRAAEAARLAPRLAAFDDDAPAAAALAARVLKAMSLTQDYAELVVFFAHGSTSSNNAHAAGLECGACGGHAGDVNARALAELLNRPAVRAALPAQGIDIPASTYFLAGLHDTTTDALTLYDTARVPASHAAALAKLETALAGASHAARAARAPGVGLPALAPDALEAAFARRARDWSETRPEWGLAGNAAFVAAPRGRTRHLDLGGRVFLHDYDAGCDEAWSTLELIMTAPLVVASWINLQYYASTVEPARFGSGNKVLHNVVGGTLGVLEGNGGDLRIGLPLQSVHDGAGWRHEPLRLAAFVEAPAAAIDGVLAKHAHVRALVANGWLALFRIDPQDGAVREWRNGGWIDA